MTPKQRLFYPYLCFSVLLLIYLPSCAHRPVSLKEKPSIPLHYKEEGIASWYGHEFHGRKTANGELFDMYGHTAAHRYLPLGCSLRVENLKNHKTLLVRVNDRGPFIQDRVLDLSYGAAQALSMVQDGIAPILLEVVELPIKLKPENLFIQVGAFTIYENAQRMYQDLSSRYPVQIHQQPERDLPPLYRVHLGPYPFLDFAQKKIYELRKSGFQDAFIIAR